MPHVNTVIIGGGPCGLNLALWLQDERDRDPTRTYVVLERHVLLNQWKNARWDGFILNTPQKYSRLHGQVDTVHDDAMGRPLEDDLGRWLELVHRRGVSYREHCAVTATTEQNGVFLTQVRDTVTGAEETYVSENVVACNGNFAVPSLPAELSASLRKRAPHLNHISCADFRNRTQLQPGGVLIIGGGQTGAQIANVLAKAERDDPTPGRRLYLTSSNIHGQVRRYRGVDCFDWCDRTGVAWMSKDDLRNADLSAETKMGMRYARAPLRDANAALSYFSLHRLGVTILGSAESFTGDTFHFRSDRRRNVQHSLDSYYGFVRGIEKFLAAHPDPTLPEPNDFPEPEWEPATELLVDDGALALSLKESGITNVIWATGWRADFSWLQIPEVLANDFDAVDHLPFDLSSSTVPGFFFSGFYWVGTFMSANLFGFEGDHAKIVAMLRAPEPSPTSAF